RRRTLTGTCHRREPRGYGSLARSDLPAEIRPRLTGRNCFQVALNLCRRRGLSLRLVGGACSERHREQTLGPVFDRWRWTKVTRGRTAERIGAPHPTRHSNSDELLSGRLTK